MTHRPLTEEERKEISKFCNQNQDMFLATIAHHFTVKFKTLVTRDMVNGIIIDEITR